MKLFQKKNNKGFSLVELIVVVAIMAVLMGILIPTLIKNVEKSKRQKDLSALEEVRSAMVTELASEKYSSLSCTISFGTGAVNLKDNNPSGSANYTNTDATQVAFIALVAEDVKNTTIGSAAYKGCSYEFVISNQSVTAYVVDGSSKYDIATIDYTASTIQTK